MWSTNVWNDSVDVNPARPERSAHSPRNTLAGSIDAARSAGMKEAAMPTMTRSAGPSKNESGSSGDVPKSALVISPGLFVPGGFNAPAD